MGWKRNIGTPGKDGYLGRDGEFFLTQKGHTFQKENGCSRLCAQFSMFVHCIQSGKREVLPAKMASPARSQSPFTTTPDHFPEHFRSEEIHDEAGVGEAQEGIPPPAQDARLQQVDNSQGQNYIWNANARSYGAENHGARRFVNKTPIMGERPGWASFADTLEYFYSGPFVGKYREKTMGTCQRCWKTWRMQFRDPETLASMGTYCLACGWATARGEEEIPPLLPEMNLQDLEDKVCETCFRRTIWGYPAEQGYVLKCHKCGATEMVDRFGRQIEGGRQVLESKDFATPSLEDFYCNNESEEGLDERGQPDGKGPLNEAQEIWNTFNMGEGSWASCPRCCTDEVRTFQNGAEVTVYCIYCRCLITLSRDTKTGEIHMETFWGESSSESEEDEEEKNEKGG